MTISDHDWDRLNAFLDGELSPEETLEIERLVSSNDEFRREYVRLSALKSTLLGLKPQPEESRKSSSKVHRLRVGWRSGIAATILLVSLLGLFGVYWLKTDQTAEIMALDLHNSLSTNMYVLAEKSPKLAVSNVKFGRLDIPDLTLSSLSLVDVLTTTVSGKDVIAMHYRGQHGCRLTLVGIEQDASADKTEFSISESVLRQSWQHRGFHFVALANGMDENRFRAISAFLIEDTKGSVEKLQRLQIAMAQAYKDSRPCA